MQEQSSSEYFSLPEQRPWGNKFPTEEAFTNFAKEWIAGQQDKSPKPFPSNTPIDLYALIQYANINWDHVLWSERPDKEPGNAEEMYHYLYTLADYLQSFRRYSGTRATKRITPEDFADEEREKDGWRPLNSFEEIRVGKEGTVEAGNHRLAALQILGMGNAKQQGIANFLRVIVHEE